MPRILLTSKSDIGLAFIPWAQERYKLRSGIWYDAPHEKVLIQYNTVAGTILIKAESGQNLVCNPYKTDKDNYSSHFFLDATKDKIFSTETDDSWKEDLPTDVEVELVDEALFGNYIVSDLDGNNYSIIAPVHHLANEPDNEILIPSYTRYAWTTNVTGRDIHTCYSEYVYSSGEPVFRGTPNPPEEEFKSALILGVGLDTNDDIHVAQLVQINKDQGYWRILDKDGVVLGIYSGDESGAISKAGKDGSIELVWKNETGNRWFVEFHNTNCISLANGLIPSSFNVYRREATNRIGAGSNKQWFYDNGTWKQYGTGIPAVLEFKGLKTENGLKKTEYDHYPSEEIKGLFNGKPVSITHKALSWSGVQGLHREKLLNVYRTTNLGYSADPINWGQDGGYYLITSHDGQCNPISVSSSIPDTKVEELDEGRRYKVVLNRRCVPGYSATWVSGIITIAPAQEPSSTVVAGYTSKIGSWVLEESYTYSSGTGAVAYNNLGTGYFQNQYVVIDGFRYVVVSWLNYNRLRVPGGLYYKYISLSATWTDGFCRYTRAAPEYCSEADFTIPASGWATPDSDRRWHGVYGCSACYYYGGRPSVGNGNVISGGIDYSQTSGAGLPLLPDNRPCWNTNGSAYEAVQTYTAKYKWVCND